MVRASKKKENGDGSTSAPPNPEAEERKRLKKLAFTRNLLSQTPAKSSVHLNPSKVVLKHHGRDIVKKSQRKNKFLFSFPGLLAPINGGKIGELKDLRTKNPILYLDFPQGQVKLFGTIVYPKNRYLTLQFSRGKNVSCEDYFDNMIVFSEAWWIGKKDENPDEVRLEFPKELTEGKDSDYDFKGGAGAGASVACQEKPTASKVREETREETPEPQSPISTPEDDDISEDSLKNLKDLIKVTPLRHSSRTAGRRFNFADPSSGDDSAEGEADMSEGEEKGVSEKLDDAVIVSAASEKPDDAVIVSAAKTEDSSLMAHATDNENILATTDLPGKSKQSSVSVKKSKETSVSKRGPLVQASIATLFKKVEKKSTGSSSKSPTLKASTEKSGKTDLKRKSDQVEDKGPRKKGKVIKEKPSGRKTAAKQKESQTETETEDTIEEISSESEDIEESDDDSCLIGEFMRGRGKGVGKSG